MGRRQTRDLSCGAKKMVPDDEQCAKVDVPIFSGRRMVSVMKVWAHDKFSERTITPIEICVLHHLRSCEYADYDRMIPREVAEEHAHCKGAKVDVDKLEPMHPPRCERIQLLLRVVDLME